MSPVALCSDSKCPLCKQCFRYNVDPSKELGIRAVTVSSSLWSPDDEICRSFWAINKTILNYLQEEQQLSTR